MFAFGCAAVALLTLVVEAVRSRSSAAWARMLMLVIVAIGLTPSFGLRAQVLGWPLLALVMLALEGGPRRAWFALPLAVVWFNLHASALVVPCVVLVFGVGTALETRRLAALWSPLALAGACALASLATPFGIALPHFILAWSANPATALIFEWLPAAPDKIAILAGVFIVAALLVAGEVRGARLSWAQRLLALGLFAATMLHIRNLGLFCSRSGPVDGDGAGRAAAARDRAAAQQLANRRRFNGLCVRRRGRAGGPARAHPGRTRHRRAGGRGFDGAARSLTRGVRGF